MSDGFNRKEGLIFMENIIEVNKEVTKAIESKRVFYAMITSINPANRPQPLSVPINVPLAFNGGATMKGVIYEEDLDENSKSGNFSYLIGKKVPFVIKDIDKDTGVLICSRVIGMEMVKEQMMEALQSGQIFEGIITGFSEFGAFVDVNGVMGMLRNADYSTDYSRVNERFKVGDHISVKCKSCGQRIVWEAVTKYHRTEPIMCNFDVGAIILGRVVDIKNFPQGVAVFVQANDQKELDVLCGMPAEMEIEKNVSVIIKITSINYPEDELEKPRLRGYIMRVA